MEKRIFKIKIIGGKRYDNYKKERDKNLHYINYTPQ
jgi:hypothetical protein